MAYPSSYNTLIDEWFNNPDHLKESDPFLAVKNTGLLNKNYFNAMPEPILGDLENNIAVVINLNPGYTGEGEKEGCEADDIVLGREQMRPFIYSDQNTCEYEKYAKPFPHLSPNPKYSNKGPHHKAAAEWWDVRQKWLEKIAKMYDPEFEVTYTNGFPDLKPVALELCPYHSKNWSESKIPNFSLEKFSVQVKWIENNPFAAAKEAIAHSRLPFIISFGNDVRDVAESLDFKPMKTWEHRSPRKEINKFQPLCSKNWPTKKDKKGNDTGIGIEKSFVYMIKIFDDRTKLKMLNISANQMKLPAPHFDDMIIEILDYIKTH